MLNISRVAALPAEGERAANTIYLLTDGTVDGLQIVVTGNTGAVLKKTKTTAEIEALIAGASGSASSDLAAAVAALEAADAANLTEAKAYTDTREADIITWVLSHDVANLDQAKAYTNNRETVIRTDFAAADAATLAAAKTYADGLDTEARADFAADVAVVAVNAATDATTKADAAQAAAISHTNTREGVIRVDFAAADAATLASANAYTDSAIGALDLSNTAVYAADIAARDALTLTKSSFVMVADASADATVDTGAALYFYNEPADTYTKIAEYESMDIVIPNLDILADLGDQGGLLTYKGTLVATVQHTGSDW